MPHRNALLFPKSLELVEKKEKLKRAYSTPHVFAKECRT